MGDINSDSATSTMCRLGGFGQLMAETYLYVSVGEDGRFSARAWAVTLLCCTLNICVVMNDAVAPY